MDYKFLLKQRRKAFKEIFAAVKKMFPFSSREEFNRFRAVYKRYYKNINDSIKNDRAFFLLVEQFLASLKNSHTKLGNYPGKVFFKPSGCFAVLINKKFYLLSNAGNLIGEILSINNKRPMDILNFNIGRISSSTQQYSVYRALLFLLSDQEGNPAFLKIKKADNSLAEITLKREKIFSPPPKNIVKAKIIKNKIGCLAVASWTGDDTKDLIDRKINYFIKNKIKALIIDIRGNGGGDSRIAEHLAGHFFKNKVLFSIVQKRISRNNFKLKKWLAYVEPAKPYLDLPIILLVDEVCFSSNEYFIAGMKDNKRAFLIGATTGGGSGNPVKFIIPYGNNSFELLVSTWIYFRPNGLPLEGKGVRPHLDVRSNLNDLIKKRDNILKMAVRKGEEMI